MTSLQVISLETLTTLPASSNILDQRLSFQKTAECSICICEYSFSKLISVCQNKHKFCRTCIEQYLLNLIDHSKVLKIPCPQSGCQQILSQDLLKNTLDDDNFQKYQTRVLSKLLNRDINSKFCPKPGCSRMIKISANCAYSNCLCGTRICNSCGGFWHEGKTCLEALDAEFLAFSTQNDFKLCFMCKSVVQKVEGCNHITCPVCDYQWCWVCGREFTVAHPKKCPQTWKPEPPLKIIKEDFRSKKPNRFSRLIFFIFSCFLKTLFLPMILFGLWNLVLNSENRKEAFCIALFGAVLSITYQITIITLILQLVTNSEGPVGFIPIIPLLILIVPLIFQLKRYLNRRRAVGTFSLQRWQTRNPNFFQYTSIARPTGQNATNQNVAHGQNIESHQENSLIQHEYDPNNHHINLQTNRVVNANNEHSIPTIVLVD